VFRCLEAISCHYHEQYHLDGRPLPTVRGGQLGERVIRPELLPPPHLQKASRSSGQHADFCLDLLGGRDEQIGILKEHRLGGDGGQVHGAPAMRAERSSKASGRYVGEFTQLNPAITPCSFTGCTVGQPQGRILSAGPSRYGSSSDIARAYNRISLSPALRRYAGLKFPAKTYVCKRAMLGIRCIPSCWDGLVSPTINSATEYASDLPRIFSSLLTASIEDEMGGIPIMWGGSC